MNYTSVANAPGILLISCFLSLLWNYLIPTLSVILGVSEISEIFFLILDVSEMSEIFFVILGLSEINEIFFCNFRC